MRATGEVAARLAPFGTSIFAEVTALAVRHGAVNLGQGFPDFDGPEFVKEAAQAAIRAGHNQYCRSSGTLELARAVSDHQRRFYGLEYDPESEITVTSGATEAIAATLLGMLDPGDEVVLFEPFYDSYPACLAIAQTRPSFVTLRAPDFALDVEALRAAVTPRTRAILLNTPHNPAGKVFTRAELEAIAALCRERHLVAISDEVYEHIVMEGEHVPLATLPGMRERTVTISSAGKTFSLTGWKIGWTCAPPALATAVRTAHQFLTFCSQTPFQHAAAVALAAGDDYYATLTRDYRARRDRMVAGLRAAGFGVVAPAGTYFVLGDARPLGFDDEVALCRALPEKVGVAAIPNSAFYANAEEGRGYVRFAFCKTDATLDEGLRRLSGLCG
jgi:N-succinyldiaminopimelate aminotransferase